MFYTVNKEISPRIKKIISKKLAVKFLSGSSKKRIVDTF